MFEWFIDFGIKVLNQMPFYIVLVIVFKVIGDLTQNILLDSRMWFEIRCDILKWIDPNLAMRWKTHNEFLDNWMNVTPAECPVFKAIHKVDRRQKRCKEQVHVMDVETAVRL